MGWHLLAAIGAALVVVWLLLFATVWLGSSRISGLADGLRLLPDTVRLLRRLLASASVPKTVKFRLWLLLIYLALPIDLIPDFIPVVGYADDVILTVLTLRSVIRRSGTDVVASNWPGSAEGLATLQRLLQIR